MALPPWGVKTFVELGNEFGTGPRNNGFIGSYIETGNATNKSAKQINFYGFQHWYSTHPAELLRKVGYGLGGGSDIIQFAWSPNNSANFKWPTNLVLAYYPPDNPAPNPNGTVGDYALTPGTFVNQGGIYPRWTTDTPYDFFAAGIGYQPIPIPVENAEYNVTELSGTPEHLPITPWSWQITKSNPQSKVLNVETDEYEYYDMTQTTTEFKSSAKIKLSLTDNGTCCWNDGYKIRGKLGIANATITATIINLPAGSGYNWAGITYKIGSATEGTPVDFELEVGSTSPVEVTIPPVDGMVSFVNDYWIEEAVPPA